MPKERNPPDRSARHIDLHSLRVMSPYAEQIISGRKSIEYRTYRPSALGPFLIHEMAGKNLYIGAVIISSSRQTGKKSWEWSLQYPVKFLYPTPAPRWPMIPIRFVHQSEIDEILRANPHANLGWFREKFQ